MKLKCSLIDNLIPLSSCQIDLLISLCRRSDELFATVRGVYYKDVLQELRANRDKKGNQEKDKCCNQTFYNALYGLQEHGIIRVSKNKETDPDFDVYICGNEFPEHTQAVFKQENYINLSADVFSRNSFKRLKGHEKYLFLYFYQYTFENDGKQTKKINKKHFYEDMTKKLGVTAPVLRRYLRSLKLFFSIGTLNGNLLITRLKGTNISKKKKTEEQHMLEQYIISQCHRLKMDFDAGVVKGLTTFIKTRRAEFEENGTLVMLSKMMRAMERSIEGYKPKERRLNGGLINKMLTKELQAYHYTDKPEWSALYNMEKLGLCF